MLLDLWIGLHVHLSTWLAACGDADKNPAYTLPLFPQSQKRTDRVLYCLAPVDEVNVKILQVSMPTARTIICV